MWCAVAAMQSLEQSTDHFVSLVALFAPGSVWETRGGETFHELLFEDSLSEMVQTCCSFLFAVIAADSRESETSVEWLRYSLDSFGYSQRTLH